MASVATLRDLIEALVEAAGEEGGEGDGRLAAVIGDLNRFFDYMRSEDVLRKTLSTTAYDASERKAVVGDIAERAGFNALTANFLGLVVEYGKLKALLEGEEPLMRKLRRASGVVRAEITLAEEPSGEDLARIREALAKQGQGDVEVIVKVDPKILGGVVAKVEDRLYDGSLRTQLATIKSNLSQLL